MIDGKGRKDGVVVFEEKGGEGDGALLGEIYLGSFEIGKGAGSVTREGCVWCVFEFVRDERGKFEFGGSRFGFLKGVLGWEMFF